MDFSASFTLASTLPFSLATRFLNQISFENKATRCSQCYLMLASAYNVHKNAFPVKTKFFLGHDNLLKSVFVCLLA